MDETMKERVRQSLQKQVQNERLSLLATDPDLQFTPMKDCYVNYVYKVSTSDGSQSCLAKCYPNHVKFLGPDVIIEEARCFREYDACVYFRSLVENCCAEPLFCDQNNSVVCLQFLESHKTWREALETSCDLHIGAKIADILVRLHSQSHSAHVAKEDFAALRDRFNCKNLPMLTEFYDDCHFVMPFQEDLQGKIAPKKLCEEVQEKLKEVKADSVVVKATQRAREWMSEDDATGQCCIHGDLHVHSLMVSRDHQVVKLIDLEFSRIGPGAYDVARLVSNYVLFYHFHQECSRQEGEGPVDHAQLMTDTLDLICITLSRYMEGMHKALPDQFDRHQVWRQLLTFLGVEIIAWVGGPPNLPFMESHAEAQLNSLNTALRILHKQSLSLDTEGLSRLIRH